MINKKVTAFLIIFTLLLGLIPSGITPLEVQAANVAVPKDGKLSVLDFNSGYTLNTAQTNGTYELSDTVKESGKAKSLKWTFTTKETKVSANLLYQRSHWPQGSDIKFRIYNPQDYNVTFVLLFFQESGYVSANIYREYATMTPGWNTYSVSQSSINNKIPSSDNVSIMFNIGGFRKNGQYNYNVGDVLYLSEAYLEYPGYGQTISDPTSSIDNGAGYVASDLGGNNTYTLTFSEPLWDGSHIEGTDTYTVDDYVTVYERNGSSYSETTQDYDITVDSAGMLDITFGAPLDTGIYKVVANSDAVFTVTGKKLAEDSEYYFSVGLASVVFAATSTVPDNGTVVMANEPGYEYIINFNNDICDVDLENMISVSPDAAYNVSGNGKSVKLTFTEALKSKTTYTVTIADSFTDTNGSFISGTKEFEFATANTVGKDGVLFDSSDDDLINYVTESSGTSFSFKHESGASFGGGKTVKVSKNKDNTNPYGKDFSNIIVPDITKYSYVNCLVYSPEVSAEGMSVLLCDTRENDSTFYSAPVTFNHKGWKTISLPLSDFVNNSADKYVDKLKLDFNRNGSKWKLPSYIFVDRIWLSESLPKSVSFDSSEFEDGAFNLDESLGGDNAYTFNFKSNIQSINLADCVSVKKYSGDEYTDFTDYTVSVSGKKLNVKFSPALSGNKSFIIKLDLSKLISSTYGLGEGIIRREFTVGGAPAYFTVTDLSFENGSCLTDISNIELRFNNNPDTKYYVPEYFWIYKDGNKVFNTYTATVSGNTVTLKFDENIGAGEYTVKISPDYKDIYGNSFTGNSDYKFKYEGGKTNRESLVIFTAGSDDNFGILGNKFAKSTDVTNLYSKTAKLSYSKGTDGATNVDGIINRGNVINTSGMKYLNLMMYLPNETLNTAHIALYTDYANNQYGGMKYVLPLDWSGWKLVSVPMSSFVDSDTYDQILFNIGGWSYKDIYESGYVLFDAIWFSSELPGEFKLSSSSFENGYTNADISGQVLKLTFTDDIDASFTPEVSFKDENNNDVTSYSYNITEDTITFTFGDLTPSTSYTVDVKGVVSKNFCSLPAPVTIDFATKSTGVFLKEINFANGNLTAVVNNLSDNDEPLTIVAYMFDNNNEYIGKTTKEFTASKNGETTQTVTANQATASVKACVFDRSGRFVSEKYLSGNKNVAVSPVLGTDKKITIDSASVLVNVFDVSLSLNGVKDAVVYEIMSEDGSLIYGNILTADKNGKLELTYDFNASAPSGKYKVNFCAGSVSLEKEFYYISKAHRDTILDLSNKTSSQSLCNCLKEVRQGIGDGNYSDERLLDLAKVITASGKFENYLKVYELIEYTDSLTNSFASSSWGDLVTIIENNEVLLSKISNKTVADFMALSSKQRSQVALVLHPMLPEYTVSGFISKLSSAITEFNKTPVQSPQYGSSSSGGGSSSVSFPTVSAPVTEKPANPQSVFTDISNVAWAQESIEKLYNEGIISKPDNGKFRPDDNITREEFTKMLVCAFAKDAPDSDYRFTDAVEGQWYNTYLSKAYSMGITKGLPDGSFGIGKNITREDMVTLCARAFESAGNSLSKNSAVSLGDAESISDYALDYVDAMVSMGVVNGMGDGTFAPKGNATRAQAAKVIALLMELSN